MCSLLSTGFFCVRPCNHSVLPPLASDVPPVVPGGRPWWSSLVVVSGGRLWWSSLVVVLVVVWWSLVVVPGGRPWWAASAATLMDRRRHTSESGFTTSFKASCIPTADNFLLMFL